MSENENIGVLELNEVDTEEENIGAVEENTSNVEEYPASDENVQKNYNIPVVGKFEKVSFETFLKDYAPIWINVQKQIREIPDGESFGYDSRELEQCALSIWDNIKLPERSTIGSAGYDFFFPFGYTELPAGASMLIPTGIKARIDPGWVLFQVPRSSLGMTYRVQFDNTIGIIDSDYYNTKDSEGHIFAKITNDSREGLICAFNQGFKFCQGIFVPFGITEDDNVTNVRTGGRGSTGA